MSRLDPNPYASPANLYSWHPSVLVRSVKRRPAFREIVLEGAPCESIVYNGRGLGYESVMIDGDEATRVVGKDAAYTTPIEFNIGRSNDRTVVSARIDIRTSMVFLISGFQLWIDGFAVYFETWYRTVRTLPNHG
ncbi:hypothetical protein SH528x_003014 [Novipirellula sp. SH528]|uniref:hypothetical protein n=1 Tax=Novipirellula sp. SH528 TaxID=3454466 RepID=UPI003FA09801